MVAVLHFILKISCYISEEISMSPNRIVIISCEMSLSKVATALPNEPLIEQGTLTVKRPILKSSLMRQIGPLEYINPNSLWWVHMGISLKERQITEEPMKVKIWKK